MIQKLYSEKGQLVTEKILALNFKCSNNIEPFPPMLSGGGVCRPSLLEEVLHSWINE